MTEYQLACFAQFSTICQMSSLQPLDFRRLLWCPERPAFEQAQIVDLHRDVAREPRAAEAGEELPRTAARFSLLLSFLLVTFWGDRAVGVSGTNQVLHRNNLMG